MGINTHALTLNKNRILTFLTIKKHYSNKYIYININKKHHFKHKKAP